VFYTSDGQTFLGAGQKKKEKNIILKMEHPFKRIFSKH